MNAVSHERYEQPPAPDPTRAPEDTSEPEPEFPTYRQPPPSDLRPAHDWHSTSATPVNRLPPSASPLPMAGFSLSLTGHVLTWISAATGGTGSTGVFLAAAATCICAGTTVSVIALKRSGQGIFRGPRWAGFGLLLGAIPVLSVLVFALMVALMMMRFGPDF